MKKISNLKTAILYAQAMYEGAEKVGQIDALYADALNLNKVLLEKDNVFGKLDTPLWKYSQKEEVLQVVCEKSGFSQSMLNTLKLMAQNCRLNILGLTLQQFILLYNEKHNMAEVEVTTVIPLTEKQENMLKSKLENIFNKQIILHYIINPQIIGGLVIKCGTNFIDNSIKHKLNALEQLMKGIK